MMTNTDLADIQVMLLSRLANQAAELLARNYHELLICNELAYMDSLTQSVIAWL